MVAPLGHTGYLVQVQDVTQQVMAERKIQQRELLLRQAFQAIPSPAVLWKQREDGKLALELYNEAALNATTSARWA